MSSLYQKTVDIVHTIFDVDEPDFVNAEVILSKENLIGAVYCSLACFCTVHWSKRKSNFPHIQYKEIQNGAVACKVIYD